MKKERKSKSSTRAKPIKPERPKREKIDLKAMRAEMKQKQEEARWKAKLRPLPEIEVPDHLDPDDMTGEPVEDTKVVLDAATLAFKELQAKERKQIATNTESGYYFVAMFESAAQ